MIVVDASTAISALLNDGPARRTLAAESLHAPHLIDCEVAHALRRQVQAGRITAADGHRALLTWQRLGVMRYPVHGLLGRIWDLRDSLTAYDASYVAVAESLDCTLVTADRRLSRAAGLRCPVSVVPG
ncbi:ribonuclease VapC9 [Mycolicibacterium madagascariense]|uniref:Ribonuclease VapC n=1 Tax=Mycolicibacterium madagascariense TaxID=212765 RepID=A0A7I7XG65_9MYCO|nr:type II toxin-antitoxin system VapC family toxin [Mycolicibacterium madagascariense]MCV7016104.1 PIN domain-containing protein [Mycolicibacterium madagascariense]BBZ28176.1 ribonuclease VapC9 [Mycolicibacterium madagascariense]